LINPRALAGGKKGTKSTGDNQIGNLFFKCY